MRSIMGVGAFKMRLRTFASQRRTDTWNKAGSRGYFLVDGLIST